MGGTLRQARSKQDCGHRGIGVESTGTINVPELDDLIKQGVFGYRPWSKEEKEVLRRYYGKVPAMAIVTAWEKKFPPGRSLGAIQCVAKKMGLARSIE